MDQYGDEPEMLEYEAMELRLDEIKAENARLTAELATMTARAERYEAERLLLARENERLAGELAWLREALRGAPELLWNLSQHVDGYNADDDALATKTRTLAAALEEAL